MDLQVNQKTTVRIVGIDQDYKVECNAPIKFEQVDGLREYLTFEAIEPGTYEVKFIHCARTKLTIKFNVMILPSVLT